MEAVWEKWEALCFPLVPSIIRALHNDTDSRAYWCMVDIFFNYAHKAILNAENAHIFTLHCGAARANVGFFGGFWRMQTPQLKIRTLSISFIGCADKMLPVNLRDYMTFGPRYKLTRDFGELVARLETLTIKRERFTHMSKKFQFCCILNILRKYGNLYIPLCDTLGSRLTTGLIASRSVNLRQFFLEYSWITTGNSDCPVDVDMSHRRLIRRLDRLLGIGGERTVDREPLTQDGATRVKVSFTWTSIEGEVLSASNVTRSDMKKWVSDFTRKRRDEWCSEL
ncbi:hypothetical protein BCON_0263g00180 [Botryotinia convoluta]|uniref:Uncharacterized protein n=1 Tax=Botryotinia convoluta TaxID=54673 RepID=A0A4Z1HSI1_9HELO|nr:hypothetical protein BCON_0263g00180 [Botryotinia convoluta]